jgi:hypothetical protein
MNSIASLSKKLAVIMGITSLATLTSFTHAPKAMSDGIHVDRPFEWTVQIDTKQLKNQFQYNSSELKELVKAKMTYYKMTDEDNKTDYEDLWYAKAKTLGMERHHKLEITQGDAICIKVKHIGEYTSYDEQRASGKAVMKVVLDAAVNKNMIATIKVPMTSFHTIAQEIENYHFSPAPSGSPESPVDSDLNLFLESEPAGLSQSFAHMH